jgi:hypothetical protein
MQQDDARVLATVRRLWQGLASPTARFTPGRVAVVVNAGSMACPPGWVGVVEIAGSALAIVPDEDTARRLAIEDESPKNVGTVDFLRSRMQIAEVLGPATLDYLLPGRFTPAEEIDVVASKASDPAIESMLSKVGDDEASESGIFGITSPLFSVRDHGRVLAVAGYRSWPLGVAHVTALTAPEARDSHRPPSSTRSSTSCSPSGGRPTRTPDRARSRGSSASPPSAGSSRCGPWSPNGRRRPPTPDPHPTGPDSGVPRRGDAGRLLRKGRPQSALGE